MKGASGQVVILRNEESAFALRGVPVVEALTQVSTVGSGFNLPYPNDGRGDGFQFVLWLAGFG